MTEDVAAFGQHRKFPPHARKTSGTHLLLGYYRFEYKANYYNMAFITLGSICYYTDRTFITLGVKMLSRMGRLWHLGSVFLDCQFWGICHRGLWWGGGGGGGGGVRSLLGDENIKAKSLRNFKYTLRINVRSIFWKGGTILRVENL